MNTTRALYRSAMSRANSTAFVAARTPSEPTAIVSSIASSSVAGRGARLEPPYPPSAALATGESAERVPSRLQRPLAPRAVDVEVSDHADQRRADAADLDAGTPECIDEPVRVGNAE